MRPTAPHSREGDAVYRLTVRGRVGQGWMRWFGADAVHPGDDSTQIVVRVADQAELLGRLRRVQDLNLRLLEVVLLPPVPSDDEAGTRPAHDSSIESPTGDHR